MDTLSAKMDEGVLRRRRCPDREYQLPYAGSLVEFIGLC
jgi:hypothetical protein